jgi:hypothetical protein
MNVKKRITSKENSPEGYRTTEVQYTCLECDADWSATYRGVWDGKNLMAEKVIEEMGQPCGCDNEAH